MFVPHADAPLWFLSHLHKAPCAPISDKVVFVDFGCGPLTSGIAFWAAFAGDRDITYLGIDSSRSMRDKALEINNGLNGNESFFPKGKGWLISDYNGLHQYLDDYIDTGDQTQIIFNFCYFLASRTLNRSDLSDCLTRIVAEYSQHKMFVIYQNPEIPEGHSLRTSYLHEKWYFLKTQLSMFQSQIIQSNTESFRYKRLTDGLSQPLKFYFDILFNNPI